MVEGPDLQDLPIIDAAQPLRVEIFLDLWLNTEASRPEAIEA